MREADFDEFGELLDAVCSLLSRGSYVPSAVNTALWFRSLAGYDLATVRAAFDAHVVDPQRGRFVPTPADLIAQIDGAVASDGRPGPEEAWAIALRSRDEADTVVWTTEIAQAVAIAKPVLDAGDEVGARMAFRETYNRLVDRAREQRMPAAWTASLGHDPERRDAAITAAVAAGQLPMSDLPMLPGPQVPLLQLAQADSCPPATRAALAKLSADLKAREDAESIDVANRRATEALKAASAEKVLAYTARSRSAMEAELALAEEGDAQQAACDADAQRTRLAADPRFGAWAAGQPANPDQSA